MIPISEHRLNKIIKEAIGDLTLFHGSNAEFDKFDIAYLSTGWGMQDHGRGFYLTTSRETARQYAPSGRIYTVQVPKGKYLKSWTIGRTEAMRIAQKFYQYYLTEDEYGKEAYQGHEQDFWDYECRYIGNCDDGESVYGTIRSLLGSDEGTTDFLLRLGYKGIVIKGGNAETGEKFKNYLIFDPDDITIISREPSPSTPFT